MSTARVPLISQVIPSALGTPNSVASLGSYEFVSVQETGQIFTYDVSSGSQVLVGAPYETPCKDPSGMVITAISGMNVMAVVCFDTASLLTLTVHANGSLSALGSVAGFGLPYPGVVLDGTNVLVPLFGKSLAANGGVAKINIASPAKPTITGIATLASPAPGEFDNPGYLAVSNGYIFVTAGSESGPLDTSSTIQVVSETTMTVVGQPLVVAHSPQQIAVQGSVAFVTLFDAAALEAIDISNPDNLIPIQIASLTISGPGCHPIPVPVTKNFVYVGCYGEGTVERFNITALSDEGSMRELNSVKTPQRLVFDGHYLLVPSSVPGGMLYQIDVEAF